MKGWQKCIIDGRKVLHSIVNSGSTVGELLVQLCLPSTSMVTTHDGMDMGNTLFLPLN